MPLVESPSLEDYAEGIPEGQPSSPKKRRKIVWGAIIILLALTFVLASIAFLQSESGALLTGRGTITGTVVDENGQPVAAEIYVLGTAIRGQADASGRFTIENVPAGTHALAVAYKGSGFEYPVTVNTGQVTELGELKFTSTLEPHEPESD
ncbi:MAG: carboxypeptidase regulatory-like domain-containing protein [Anaerolineae bacterium]|nr:MAG: carboxypeptidase regulatory-like domain-containing protein [Anaerolineae bacterium]